MLFTETTRNDMVLGSIVAFILEHITNSIYNKCSEYINYYIFDRELDNHSEMGEPENIWFDGVDKKLIEAHSRDKTKLVEGSDKTLVTKTPLESLPSFSKKKVNKKNLEQNGVKTNGITNGHKKKSCEDKSSTSSATLEHIKPNTGITDELAIDCEMVECYHHKSVLARVSIVNLFGHPILDSYVAPPSKVTDYRTRYSGIRKKDLDNAPDFETIQAEVARIIKDKIVVGHAIHNDFSVLKMSHPPEKTRDTSHYFKNFFLGKTPSLKKLSETILGVSIQKGEHDSVQDAQATMKLYVHVRDKWNDKVVKKIHSKATDHRNTKKQKTKPKKKKIKAFYVTT